MKYHPDRLRAEGMPEALIEQATKTMADINNAWDDSAKNQRYKMKLLNYPPALSYLHKQMGCNTCARKY